MLSYLAGAMAIAPMVGPILGGWLTALFGWRANFLALAAFGGLVTVAVAAVLAETNRLRDPLALRPDRLLAGWRTIAAHPAFRLHVLAAGFVYSGIFCFISGSSYVLIGLLGLSPPAYGAAFAIAVTGYMLGGFAGGRLQARAGPAGVMGIGATVAALAALAGFLPALAGTPAAALIVAPAFVFFLGAGMVLPGAMAGAITPFPERAGSASALLGFGQLVIGAAVGVLLAHLYDGTARPMTGLLAATAVATWLVARRIRTLDRTAQRGETLP